MLRNELYRRDLVKRVPEGHPPYLEIVTVTEEVNIIAVWVETLIDGDGDGPELKHWVPRPQHDTSVAASRARAKAIEYAVERVLVTKKYPQEWSELC